MPQQSSCRLLLFSLLRPLSFPRHVLLAPGPGAVVGTCFLRTRLPATELGWPGRASARDREASDSSCCFCGPFTQACESRSHVSHVVGFYYWILLRILTP